MKMRVAHLALVFGLAGAVSVGCGSDDDTTTSPKGGAGGVSGSAGKGGSGAKGGSGGTGETGDEGGSAGEGGASAGSDQGGAAGDTSGNAGSSGSGEGGSGGESHVYTEAQVERGKVLVRSVALCGGCHTRAASGTEPAGLELGGNPNFAKGTLPAPNLTDDPAGIGNWSDQEVINAIRNGVDDEGRQLNSAMPYWLFHNMNDADALSIVAFLRSLPHASTAVGESNPGAPEVAPLAPSTLPDTTLAVSSPDYEAAVYGKYLLSGIAGCVKCHSPANNGFPIADFFSGVPPATTTTVFAPNITPDDSGIGGWTVTDVVTALKLGTNKAGRALCGSMPSAAKGYGGMTDADAHAIGVYLTTIPGVVKTTTDPDNQNPCPPPAP